MFISELSCIKKEGFIRLCEQSFSTLKGVFMLILLLIICIVIISVLLFLYINLRKDVIECAKQMRYIHQEKSSIKIGLSSKFMALHEIADYYQIQRDEVFALNQKQLEQEKEMKTLITNISHDIRTPLTSISGYIEMMENASENDLMRYKDIISSRLYDMEEMLDTFFQYTAIQAQREPLELVETALYPLLCEVLLSYHSQLAQHNIVPKIICKEESILTSIHQESMKRILQNMINNTLRYGSDPYCIHLYRSENHIVLKMSNALAKDINTPIDVEHIFDRFYKGNTSRQNKGSGLGMAIVKELCKQMHIDVQATMEDNMLVFTFLFELT